MGTWSNVIRGASQALAFSAAACVSHPANGGNGGADPTRLEVPLQGGRHGWSASLVIDNGETGIWTVEALQVFEQYATPEVVGLDDQGQVHVLVSYSGKWTPQDVIHEGEWLGGLAHGDVDPRVKGAELYTGGKRGNLYQIVSYRDGGLDYRRIARFPGREIHTIVSGDLDPRSPGKELIVFTRPGAMFRVSPTGEDGKFESSLLEELPGRVRDALVLPGKGSAAEIATVMRSGSLRLLQFRETGASWRTIYEASMGKGRIALRPGTGPVVLYTTHDDGRILRHERTGAAWRTEVIYRGPQGPRGIAAGRFDADANVETVAVFGYSRAVELLSRRAESWHAETIFEDRDKGHWLAAAELDGRNETDELLLSGYGARVVLLFRR